MVSVFSGCLSIMVNLLGKTHVSHRIDKTLDKSLYRGDNPHLMNRFLRMS